MSARPLTDKEYDAILAALERLGRHRDRLLIQLGCAVGFRVSELLTLRVSQLITPNGPAHEVVVARRLLKGGVGLNRDAVRSRRVALGPVIREAIAQHFIRRANIHGPDEFVFLSREGRNRPVSAAHVHRILDHAAFAAGVSLHRLSTHTLRKTFAARVYAATGHDLIKTQRILGHVSPLTTARYLETYDNDLDRVVRAIGR